MSEYQFLSTSELVDACRAGRKAAWDALVERYQSYIYSIIVRILPDRDDRKDAFQNVFLILHDNLAQLRERDKLAPYLFQITRRECLRLKRQDERLETSVDEIFGSLGYDRTEESPEQFLLRVEQQLLVRQAVALLPARCRVIVEDLFLSGNPGSYVALAEKLSLPVASIGPNRQRCLEKLRRILMRMGAI